MEGGGSSPAPANEQRIAFDITTGNPRALALQLKVIELTRTQLIAKGQQPKMVIAFRGDASYYTNTNLSLVKEPDRAEALAIRKQIRDLKAAAGVVGLEQCTVPLAARKLKAEDTMQEVKVVQNGWISLVDYQRMGYAYIVP
jgi:intracellular sulfur oxidation DsrE/DsrF family protein